MRHILFLLMVCGPIGLNASHAATVAVDTHAQAASELLATMNVQKEMATATEVMVDQMIKQNPMLGPYRDALLKWAATFMTWDVFGARLVALYEDAFTEAELRELKAFYETPLGQKTLTAMPGLLRQSADLGSTIAKEHLPELETAIRARASELEKMSPKP